MLILRQKKQMRQNSRKLMADKEKEIFDLTVDIDFAPLSVQLSLEDRKILANALLMLGYKKEIKEGDKNGNKNN